MSLSTSVTVTEGWAEAGTQDRDMVGSKDVVLGFGGHGAVGLALFHPSGHGQAWVGTA